MSALLAAIGAGFIGLAVGAALQRWGDADRATHGHQDYPDEGDSTIGPELWADVPLTRWSSANPGGTETRVALHSQIADQWSGW